MTTPIPDCFVSSYRFLAISTASFSDASAPWAMQALYSTASHCPLRTSSTAIAAHHSRAFPRFRAKQALQQKRKPHALPGHLAMEQQLFAMIAQEISSHSLPDVIYQSGWD
jgi:hypothetical protein